MTKPRVLISGASIAGPALAYWLIKAGCTVTIIERSPIFRSAGQGIDIRDEARTIVKKMGIFETILSKSSHEEGMSFVDGSNRAFAKFPVDQSGKGEGPTSDVEILRGELAGILYDVTKDDVKYIFGDRIESIEQIEGGSEVRIGFVGDTPDGTYDLVVGADGLGSGTRGIVFGKESVTIRSLNAYVSYFSIPPDKTDTQWGRTHWTTGGRCMLVRPDNVGLTRCFLTITTWDGSDARLPRLRQVVKEGGGVAAQKALTQELFQDVDWEVPRMLKGMKDADDFYMQHVAQVKMDHWSKGRVTLIGDAGYAPSPFTGMGTSLAFIGAYILAGEISKNLNDIPAALESYEAVLRPHVEGIQKLPPGIPWIVNPQTRTGLRVLQTAVQIISFLWSVGVFSIFSKLASFIPARKEPFKLPYYEAFES